LFFLLISTCFFTFCISIYSIFFFGNYPSQSQLGQGIFQLNLCSGTTRYTTCQKSLSCFRSIHYLSFSGKLLSDRLRVSPLHDGLLSLFSHSFVYAFALWLTASRQDLKELKMRYFLMTCSYSKLSLVCIGIVGCLDTLFSTIKTETHDSMCFLFPRLFLPF